MNHVITIMPLCNSYPNLSPAALIVRTMKQETRHGVNPVYIDDAFPIGNIDTKHALRKPNSTISCLSPALLFREDPGMRSCNLRSIMVIRVFVSYVYPTIVDLKVGRSLMRNTALAGCQHIYIG